MSQSIKHDLDNRLPANRIIAGFIISRCREAVGRPAEVCGPADEVEGSGRRHRAFDEGNRSVDRAGVFRIDRRKFHGFDRWRRNARRNDALLGQRRNSGLARNGRNEVHDDKRRNKRDDCDQAKKKMKRAQLSHGAGA